MLTSAATHRRSVLFVVLTLLAFVAVVGARAQRKPITITTEVIRVPVTVLDGRGRFVTGLKQEDFEVLENGTLQELTSFAVQDSDVTAVLLLDVSGSMGVRLEEAKRAAAQFVRQIGPRDLVKAAQFNDKVTSLSDFSTDKSELEGAVSKAKAGGGTALHNALWTALAELESRKERDEEDQRHRAIVVLSDGDDTASGVTTDEVMVRARRADVAIYALSLDRLNEVPVTDSIAAIFLRELANQTGGQLLFPTMTSLQKTYRQLADELKHQYTLGYVPAGEATRSQWKTISVRVKNRKNLRLRHRLGYFASATRNSE
jgi:Ca-activated chloride channel family protein